MKCFYHNDSDGKCAGFWVLNSVKINDSKEYDSEFIEIDYRIKFPMESIRPNEQIYIVDYSISTDEMTQLLSITKDVTWIDHHKTAIDKYKDYPYNIRGIRYDGIAGCMLTYCYIHHMTYRGLGCIKPFDVSMTEDAPMFTKLIADWDVWKFAYGKSTSYFQIAFNAYDFNPRSLNWDKFTCNNNELDTVVVDLISEGKSMIKFRDGWAKDYCRCKGFQTNFEGYKCFALNLGNCNSEYFKSINNGDYEILLPFSYDGSKWTYSLYSKTVDVSEIAKKYGGGGHKGAAGFVSNKLLFAKE